MGVESTLAMSTLIELSNDKHPDVRDWATFSIGTQSEMNSPDIIEALKARLNDEDVNTRREAICGLARRKDHSVRQILIDELAIIDDHGSIILESIEEFGDKSFIPLLEDQLKKNQQLSTINEQWLLDCINTLKSHEP
jgi:HEAT repeat protein